MGTLFELVGRVIDAAVCLNGWVEVVGYVLLGVLLISNALGLSRVEIEI